MPMIDGVISLTVRPAATLHFTSLSLRGPTKSLRRWSPSPKRRVCLVVVVVIEVVVEVEVEVVATVVLAVVLVDWS